MVNMTLSIPENLHKIIKKHNEIKWSEIARRAMWKKARILEMSNKEQLAWMDKVLAKSKLTEKDAEEIGNKIKEGIARRHDLII